MIKFALKHINEVQPAGTGGDLRMSWFWLTEGNLWLEFGDSTIFEYTPEAQEYFGNRKTQYNDYPIVRFIEDFADIFNVINESIPKELYDSITDLEGFYKNAEKWWSIIDPNEEEIDDKSFKLYDTLISWAYNRSFDSGHLVGGPKFSFFRHKNKIKIIWKTEFKLENGNSLWTAKDGNTEMIYSEFVSQIRNFGEKFFSKMQDQVEAAIKKEWKNVQIDKEGLVAEHKEREVDFFSQLAKLKEPTMQKTNWQLVAELNVRMKNKLKRKPNNR